MYNNTLPFPNIIDDECDLLSNDETENGNKSIQNENPGHKRKMT